MKYRRLAMTDFGVYRGTQEFTFSRETGVWIVYGRNGRGKTTLLNAFRFALYGIVLGRTAEPRSLAEVGSSQAGDLRDAGQAPSFAVELDFSHGESEYQLVRSFRNGSSSLHLTKNGAMLSEDAANREMLVVAPKSISQFFLFDGELLRQYEDLTVENSDAAVRLREEVDRILGVTAILQTAEHLRSIHAEEGKTLAEEASKQKKSEQAGRHLTQALASREALVNYKSEREVDLRGRREELDTLEQMMRDHENAREAVGRLDEARRALEETRQRIAADESTLGEMSPNMWAAILSAPLMARVEEVEREREAVEERRSEHALNIHLRAKLEHSGSCPVCRHELTDVERSSAISALSSAGAESEHEHLTEKSTRLRAQEKSLRRIAALLSPNELRRADKDLRDRKVEKLNIERRIATIEEDIGNIDQQEVKSLQTRRDNAKLLVEEARADIEKTSRDLQEKDNQIDRLRKQLSASGVSLDETVRARSNLAESLASLFSAAVEAYQQKVLSDVQREATDLFRKMRYEVEFASLDVSSGYGLRILDVDGNEMKGHSAGYAHLIALSLIGALQRCSPVRGPIVMDSPFGRLDPDHQQQVVAALPEVADQVLLLVFEGEFDRDAATAQLGGHLVAEHVLVRESARHTRILAREAAQDV